MPASTTHRALTKHPRWFENQTRNRPWDRVNSNSKQRPALSFLLSRNRPFLNFGAVCPACFACGGCARDDRVISTSAPRATGTCGRWAGSIS